MENRERLLKTLRKEKVDRIPIAPLIYLNAVYEMFDYSPEIDTWTDPPDFDVIEKSMSYFDRYGFDAMNFLGHVWDFYGYSTYNDQTVTQPWENWDVTVDDEWIGDSKRRTISIRTPKGSLSHAETYKKLSRYMVVWATEEYLIKTRQDFDVFCEFAPPADRMDTRLVQRARQAIGDKGIVMSGTQGVFNTMNVFRKLDDLFMDPIKDEGFYRAMADYFLERLISRVPIWVEAGSDLIEIGANLAGSGVGPKFFEKFVMPYEKKLIDTIHQAGSFVGYHNCGDAAKIMHLYNQMDMDYWGYLTPPPYGDVLLEDALRVIRPDMVLRGNIDQVDFMVKATPQQVKERVRVLLEKVKPRGNWILSTTDFWIDHVPDANLEAFVSAGKEYGAY